MRFQILPLDPTPYRPLFALDDTELREHAARSVVADASPGYPCRVSLADAAPGSRLILVNHTHLATTSPYRASHAVYIGVDAVPASLEPDELPVMLTRRPVSIRAFDRDDMMIAGEVTEGAGLEPIVRRLLDDPKAVQLHIHTARFGCYLATAVRA